MRKKENINVKMMCDYQLFELKFEEMLQRMVQRIDLQTLGARRLIELSVFALRLIRPSDHNSRFVHLLSTLP